MKLRHSSRTPVSGATGGSRKEAEWGTRADERAPCVRDSSVKADKRLLTLESATRVSKANGAGGQCTSKRTVLLSDAPAANGSTGYRRSPPRHRVSGEWS